MSWLGDRDSNPDSMVQSHVSYRWTISQAGNLDPSPKSAGFSNLRIIRHAQRHPQRSSGRVLGTLVLIAFGSGVVAEVVLSGGAGGSPLSIHLAWGIAVTMGIYVSAGVSGAHLNPAVTLALCVLRGFPWGKLPAFVAAQVAGAFAGAALTFVTYREAFTTSTAACGR